MGSKFAPTYASLTIGYLEEKLQDELKLHFESEICEYIFLNYRRFLDDCFTLWHFTLNDLFKFHSLLNCLDDDIKYTLEYSHESLPFLDVLIMKNDDNLCTDIFYKLTDSKQYLPFDSCHPKHNKVNIPFTLGKRISMIVSDKNTRIKRLQELAIYLQELKYPHQIIITGLKKALEIDREELLQDKNTKAESNKIIPYISEFNPHNSNVFNHIKNNMNILTSDTKMKEIFNKYKIINCHRQPANLKRILTRAKHSKKSHEVKICNKKKCSLCSLMVTGKSYKFKNGMVFNVNYSMDCDTKNVIYVLICNNCKLEYIGETSDFRARMALHKQHINKIEYSFLKVSEHIRNCNCTNNSIRFQIMPIFKIHFDDKDKRKVKEAELIKKLKPALNSNSPTHPVH